MKNDFLILIQARMGATRLPGKVLLPLPGGKTVLENIAERMIKVAEIIPNTIVAVATTVLPEDDSIYNLCVKKKIKVFRGSSEDVLDRFYQAVLAYKKDNIIRITADCPLIDPHIILDAIRIHLEDKPDYTSNVITPTYPDGEDVEIFTFNALEKAWKEAKLKSEREHVTPYIKNHPEFFKLRNFNCPLGDFSSLRWTLDEPRDYEFIKTIYSHFSKNNSDFTIAEILKYISKNPQISSINEGIKRNEGYLKSLKEDKVIK